MEQKEIIINFTSNDVLIPDSNTSITSYSQHAITTPSIKAESSGTTSWAYTQTLKSDFASQISDLCTPITITAKDLVSGTSLRFFIIAERCGESVDGMSSWYIYTSNNHEMRLAESVLERPADLNQCVEALVVKAAGRNFSLGTKDKAIIKSTKTLQCLNKS
ncbi:hypothetical protein HYT00_02930 [Candidatus Giovannonibacteria bacterium]|nr:hypothetical protein [Candidatus Giovannonibacteria bacterium]